MTSLLTEPQLSIFCTPPKHQLKLNCDIEEKSKNVEANDSSSWINLEMMFEKDLTYKSMQHDLMRYIDHTLHDLVFYCQV